MSVRLARLSIRDFGPLRELVLVPDDITVVYGQNEAGKTSCIDALVRALRERVQAGSRKLIDVTREGPGFDGDIELTLNPEDGGAVLELLREHPSLARLFIVRDADPSLERGRSWLNAIRGRLIGIDLAAVTERVRARAGLTHGGTLRESRDDERQRLAERLARIEGFIEGLPAFGKLLEETHQVERGRRRARDRVEKLRAAERYERFRTADRAAGAVRESERRMRELERFTDEDLAAWREAISDLREAAAVAKSAENESARLRDERTLAEEEAKKRRLASDKSRAWVDEVARAHIAEDLENARLTARNADTWSTWRTPLAIGAVVFGALAIGLILRATAGGDLALSLGLGGGAAATCGLVAAGLSITANQRMRQASSLADELLARARVQFDSVETLEDCRAQLQGAASTLERNEAEFAATTRAIRQIEDQIGSASRTEEDRNRHLSEVQRQIAEIRDRVGLSSIEQLEEKNRDRARAQAGLAEAQRTLASLLGDVDPDQPLESQVAVLKVDNPGVAPSPAELAALEHEIEGQDERLMALRTRLNEQHEHALARIGLDDLGKADAERQRLERSLEAIDNEAAGAELALQALRELASDIDRPLREALGSGPVGAGRYLARLTAGRYRAIILEGESNLAVERDDGSLLPVESLSRGARDQLALAVRLALVRRLLGEPGFLVLDDAFLTSDATRREALATALSDLAEEGWQILYFTFDPALRDRLARLQAKVIELPAPTRLQVVRD